MTDFTGHVVTRFWYGFDYLSDCVVTVFARVTLLLVISGPNNKNFCAFNVTLHLPTRFILFSSLFTAVLLSASGSLKGTRFWNKNGKVFLHKLLIHLS